MLWNSTSLSGFQTNLIFNGADWSGLVLNASAISVWPTLLAQPATAAANKTTMFIVLKIIKSKQNFHENP